MAWKLFPLFVASDASVVTIIVIGRDEIPGDALENYSDYFHI